MKATKSDLDMSGTRLGKHTIIKLIGKGGIGSVYLARNETTRDLEALKILLPDMTASHRAVERFKREITNSQALQHQNIVKRLDYGNLQDIWYYTMEYCKGGSLENLVLSDGIKSVSMACDIILKVLDGLEYAHNAELPEIKMNDGSFSKGVGLIHRDIKPENILILNKVSECRRIGVSANKKNATGSSKLEINTDDRRLTTDDLIIKISDFGLAKNYAMAGRTGYTQTGSVGGSLAFISRQQLINYKYSKPEVDVWSTAAVLYFLLTAQPPRDCESEKNPFNAILKNNPIPIRSIEPSVPEKLALIIDKALDDSSSLYYKKAKDLSCDILAFLKE